ncbi:hypothetical protein [Egicoccus sp. AB-alg6-2]|uniref:hypothetical protein n=1 Tax=Egicoccus sp. AB-alg6-2 TaxID=3242692 RepID=UPI00359D3BE6
MPVSADARESTTASRRRWPPLGRGQPLLLVASIGVLVGSFLPWVDTIAGRFTGMEGGGVWTFYAGFLGLAGGLVPRRGLARLNGAIAAVTAIGLPLWQLQRLNAMCDWQVCMPSTGLVLVAGCGLLAARATHLLGRTPT